jgi:2-keto-3-deoxy-L-rhamnonate aldolase RhmA
VTPIVRVPANTSDWISRALDGGAAAVIVPHVNSVAEAENVVRYAKFAPLGERSATSGMPILRYNSVPAKYANPVANDATVVICMIETERALEIAEWVRYDRRDKIDLGCKLTSSLTATSRRWTASISSLLGAPT